jgi:hypothetical protein
VLRQREGRRNRYQVKPELPLRHPLVQEREVGDLLEVLIGLDDRLTRQPGSGPLSIFSKGSHVYWLPCRGCCAR